MARGPLAPLRPAPSRCGGRGDTERRGERGGAGGDRRGGGGRRGLATGRRRCGSRPTRATRGVGCGRPSGREPRAHTGHSRCQRGRGMDQLSTHDDRRRWGSLTGRGTAAGAHRGGGRRLDARPSRPAPPPNGTPYPRRDDNRVGRSKAIATLWA